MDFIIELSKLESLLPKNKEIIDLINEQKEIYSGNCINIDKLKEFAPKTCIISNKILEMKQFISQFSILSQQFCSIQMITLYLFKLFSQPIRTHFPRNSSCKCSKFQFCIGTKEFTSQCKNFPSTQIPYLNNLINHQPYQLPININNNINYNFEELSFYFEYLRELYKEFIKIYGRRSYESVVVKTAMMDFGLKHFFLVKINHWQWVFEFEMSDYNEIRLKQNNAKEFLELCKKISKKNFYPNFINIPYLDDDNSSCSSNSSLSQFEETENYHEDLIELNELSSLFEEIKEFITENELKNLRNGIVFFKQCFKKDKIFVEPIVRNFNFHITFTDHIFKIKDKIPKPMYLNLCSKYVGLMDNLSVHELQTILSAKLVLDEVREFYERREGVMELERDMNFEANLICRCREGEYCGGRKGNLRSCRNYGRLVRLSPMVELLYENKKVDLVREVTDEIDMEIGEVLGGLRILKEVQRGFEVEYGLKSFEGRLMRMAVIDFQMRHFYYIRLTARSYVLGLDWDYRDICEICDFDIGIWKKNL